MVLVIYVGEDGECSNTGARSHPAGNSELRATWWIKNIINDVAYLSHKSLFLPKFISYSFFVLLSIQIFVSFYVIYVIFSKYSVNYSFSS